MEKAFHQVELRNGLILSFFDRSNRYFGDYHRVKIEVRGPIPVCAACFPEASDPDSEAEQARKILGAEVVFGLELERMGVAGRDVETVRRALVDEFLRASRVYLEQDEFPRRYLNKRLNAMRQGAGGGTRGVWQS